WLRVALARNLADAFRRLHADRRDIRREQAIAAGVESSALGLEHWLAAGDVQRGRAGQSSAAEDAEDGLARAEARDAPGSARAGPAARTASDWPGPDLDFASPDSRMTWLTHFPCYRVFFRERTHLFPASELVEGLDLSDSSWLISPS